MMQIENICTHFSEQTMQLMHTAVKIVQYSSASAVKHCTFMGLLKEIEDNGFDDLFFASPHWLSHGRALLRFTVLLTPRFSENKDNSNQIFKNQRLTVPVCLFTVLTIKVNMRL